MRYFTLSEEEITRYLSEGERMMLVSIQDSIASGRKLAGLSKHSDYIIVPEEDPKYEEIQKLLRG